jgi:hypothetical protein
MVAPIAPDGMAGKIGEVVKKEKGQNVSALSFYPRLPTMPLFSWGNLLNFFSWKPARKDARTSEKPQLVFYISIFVPKCVIFIFP